MISKPDPKELIAQLPTPAWELKTGNETPPVKNRTLEELVRITHDRHTKGEPPGLIRKMETAIELDLIQLQELWAHLGLPM